MDFYQVKEREIKPGKVEVYPDFKVFRSKDLMVRGKAFYAIWNEESGLWSDDEYDVVQLVDSDVESYQVKSSTAVEVHRKYLSNFGSNAWLQFRSFLAHVSDNSHQLDENLTFRNTEVKKTDYVSRRLPYDLAPGDISAYEELFSTLYDEDELRKLEWAIGAIVAGDAKDIQKFVVLYGTAGSGKSTWLNMLQQLFPGYYAAFEAKALTSSNNNFATEVFRNNPLVAIQHDGDLSKIEDNSKFNSIISHEYMTMNVKYKPSYDARINAMMFMASNKAVKISDAKSGIIRRLIDVQPSGNRVGPRKYQSLVGQIEFELGAIAYHCLQTYRELGKDYYDGYRPLEMMLQTDVFFNFIENHYDLFKEQNGVTLNQAFELYKVFCEESLIEFKVPRYKFRDELRNYFKDFEERTEVEGIRVRSWYSGFLFEKFELKPPTAEEHVLPLVMDHYESLFDEIFAGSPAQYANVHGTPIKKWAEVETTLGDLDTSQLHYVKPGEQHIVIDFDLKDENGEKSAQLNLEAASKWPSTYAEHSQGGAGIHLHYDFEGDVSTLSRIFAEGIEVKVFTGDASLRRRIFKCNNVPIAKLSGGLPLREKKLMNGNAIKSERSLREQIQRNLRKEIHPGTKPSIDFIHKILEDAYMSGLKYDVSDMKNDLFIFANNSSHQAMYCIKVVQTMRFHSEVTEEATDSKEASDDRLVFFDCEVFPNLFVVCWKFQGPGTKIVRMINPTPQQIEELMTLKLVGFNCRKYDNHILYGRYMGYNNEQLYKLSQQIISNDKKGMFGEAYDISYTDIYDFSSLKQSLKKFQVELGIRHKELGLPWDEPVPEELWGKVAEYCDNDVISEEAVFEARREDFTAREILSALSGLSVNATTQQHTSRIVFNGNSRPQEEFVYTDLSERFPGYAFDKYGGVSTYRGEITGEGGYVYAEPGMYTDVALLDISSMHPTTIEELDLFGKYTKNFNALTKARLAIKRKDYDAARKMLDGKLAPHLENPEAAEALSYALKIVINIVYGLTSAKFDNAFRDPRNIDNIVAKRGALFMVDLKNAVQSQGFQVAHIKTDSIKIPNATKEIIDFVMEFGNNYGYTFEHEKTFDKFCLVNDAVYVGHALKGKKPAHWDAVGKQFQEPYVFKTLFTKEKIEFADLCEVKTVTTALYLDFDGEDVPMALEKDGKHFVGRAGSFCPILPGKGGGLLLREKDGKFYAAVGTKGYRWMEAEMVTSLGLEKSVDMSYFEKKLEAAKDAIAVFGDVESFLP